MKRDPDKITDATAERRVDWDKEKEAGHLLDVSGQPGREKVERGPIEHVQGLPLTPADALKRVVPSEVMKHVSETGRYPAPTSRVGVTAPAKGWPRFGPDGSILLDGAR